MTPRSSDPTRSDAGVLGNDRLHTGPAGYRLVVAPEELDLLQFHALRTGGERALRGGDPAGVAEQLRAALALWRGAPFADLPRTTPLELDAARVDEQHLATVEAYAQARLDISAADHVGTDLRSLVLQHRFAPFQVQPEPGGVITGQDGYWGF